MFNARMGAGADVGLLRRVFFFVPILLQLEKRASPATRVRALLVAATWMLVLFAVCLYCTAVIASMLFLVVLHLLLLLFSTMTLFSLQSLQEGMSPAEAERIVNPMQECAAALRVVQLVTLLLHGTYWTALLAVAPAVAHDAYCWSRGEMFMDETTIWRDRKTQEWAGLRRFALDAFAFVWLLTLLVMLGVSGHI